MLLLKKQKQTKKTLAKDRTEVSKNDSAYKTFFIFILFVGFVCDQFI